MSIRLPLLLLLAAAALACGGSEHDRTLAKLEELERQLEKGRELEQNLPALEREVSNVSSAVEDLGAVLIVDELDAPERLRNALLASGFAVVDLQELGPSTVDGVRVLSFEVEAVTRFEAATAAFEALEMRPLLVIVEDLSLRRDGERARLAFTAQVGLASTPP